MGIGKTLTSRLIQAQPVLCRWIPAAALIFLLAWCFVSVRPGFSWDDAEPEILNQAWRFAKGESLYHGIGAPPYAFAVYPPIYYVLVGLLMKLTGLNFLPAKLVSFLSALSIAWAIVLLSRAWNRNARGGIWASFFLFLIPAFLYNATRCNVQMMAVALSIWSLFFFLRNRWKETVILSPLLAVFACYTKQSSIAFPIAMLLFLALKKRRWLIPYALTLTTAGLIPFLWLQKISDGFFFINTVKLAQLSYNVFQIPLIFMHHAGPVLPFIGLAVAISWGRLRKGTWGPMDCYIGCTLAITLVSLGRVGAHGQYVLELLVVTILYLLRTTDFPLIRGRDAIVALQVLLLLIYTPIFIVLEEGVWDISAIRAADKICPLLDSTSGPILSQQGSFPLFSRGGIYIQLFHFTALSRAGLWDQNLLLQEINQQTFPFVITEFPLEKPISSENERERFTPEMLEVLRKNYRVLEVQYPYYVYVPRAQ